MSKAQTMRCEWHAFNARLIRLTRSMQTVMTTRGNLSANFYARWTTCVSFSMSMGRVSDEQSRGENAAFRRPLAEKKPWHSQ